MSMIPFDRMWERVEIARQDADSTLFLTLLYFGEMVLKMVGAGLVAAIESDRERHRYRQIHRLVRANGIGEWVASVDDILTGPASQYLTDQARQEQKELTTKSHSGTWQHEAVSLMHRCARFLDPDQELLPAKVDARRWLALFSSVRNMTRGHGAPQAETCGKLCQPLERSIRVFTDNYSLFGRPWAFLYRNLSGRYRVTKLTQPATEFDPLKTSQSTGHSFVDGIHVYFDEPRNVELMISDVELTDFFFPNGGFNDRTFQLISYLTNSRRDADASPFRAPATPLPASETQGIGSLDQQGQAFGNLPPRQNGYIGRSGLEAELYDAITDDHHPVITLVGSGGIGKTWLALTVLHKVASEARFAALLWFSARDIDLLPQGPKLVGPHVLTVKDIATEFARLIEPSEAKRGGFDPARFLSAQMTKSNLGPLLFVFDNFETVRVPGELYAWIDTYIRLPNKVLITSRIRDFKGDYPIDVTGMTENESEELIRTTAEVLGIQHLLTDEYKRELFQEAGGHPYVMKVLLGEVAKAGTVSKVERIVASMESMLDALFERTFSQLSPAAKRVFLTLCAWRSTVPLLALEAILLRPSTERMDVANAAEELSRSSFVELSTSPEDGQLFLTVPLVAAVFGKRKLVTSPARSSIEADLPLLRAFGAAQQLDISHGVLPRVKRLFQYVADRTTQGKDRLDDYVPMLEFIAQRYPPAWPLLSRLFTELNRQQEAKDAIRRYIESGGGDIEQKHRAWQTLGGLCRQTGDAVGEINALVGMCELPGVPFRSLSEAVNRANELFSKQHNALESEEKRIISLRMAEVMEARIEDGDSTDCSRLGWLYLRLGEVAKAQQVAEKGISAEPDNPHCQNLLDRLAKGKY